MQAELDGITRPKRRSRAGRPPLPPEQRRAGQRTISYYREDEAALQALRDAGWTGGTGALMRRALRERAAQIASAPPQQEGRLV